MATQTVIAHVSIVDQLIALIQQAASNVTASAREEDGANLRGVFTDASAVRTKEIVDDAIAKGAKIIAGKYEITQNVVQPLLLSNVTPEMRTFVSSKLLRLLLFDDRSRANRNLSRGDVLTSFQFGDL